MNVPLSEEREKFLHLELTGLLRGYHGDLDSDSVITASFYGIPFIYSLIVLRDRILGKPDDHSFETRVALLTLVTRNHAEFLSVIRTANIPEILTAILKKLNSLPGDL